MRIMAVAAVAVALISFAGCGDSELQELSARVSELENAYRSIRTELDQPASEPGTAADSGPDFSPGRGSHGDAAPRATLTPTPRPTLTPTLIDADGTSATATVNADEGLNARAEPSIESAVLAVLRHDFKVELTGETQVIDEIEWVEISQGGWVQSQFLVFP